MCCKHSKSSLCILYGPRRDITCLRGFWQSGIQTSFLRYRGQLENRNFTFTSLDMTILKMGITKLLIRLRGCSGWSAPLLFANTEDRFSSIGAHKNVHNFWTTESVFFSPYRVLAERERQRAIAKERLAARRQKKQQTILGEQQTAEQLLEDEEQSKMEDIVNDSQGMGILHCFTFSTRP